MFLLPAAMVASNGCIPNKEDGAKYLQCVKIKAEQTHPTTEPIDPIINETPHAATTDDEL
jgi:hypothetical protein